MSGLAIDGEEKMVFDSCSFGFYGSKNIKIERDGGR
jgi:hypothetical protein